MLDSNQLHLFETSEEEKHLEERESERIEVEKQIQQFYQIGRMADKQNLSHELGEAISIISPKF